MRKVASFLNSMDESAWRAVFVSTCLFLGVAIMLVVGKSIIFADTADNSLIDRLQEVLLALRSSPLGLPVVVILFCLAAFIGAPQFLLITLAVTAFGPVQGFGYAWFATICSMALTFWVGRAAGEEVVRKYGGDLTNRLSRFVGKNDLWASAVVRNVPTAPFIVVNMAFGVSQARFWRYLLGSALGTLPKHLIVAFGGQAVITAVQGNLWIAAAAFAVSMLIWIPLVLMARNRVANPETENAPSDKKISSDIMETS